MSSLLPALHDALRRHISKEPIERFFNRQLHERVCWGKLKAPKHDWAMVRLADEHVEIVAERWTLDDLRRLRTWHTRPRPEPLGEGQKPVPIVVFRGWGHLCLIDGQNRVNLWLERNDVGPHPVLVVKPRGELENPFPGT